MSIIDYFVAAMKCPHCGTVSPAEYTTGMQTHIRTDSHSDYLATGFVFDKEDLTEDSLVDASYAPTGNLRPDDKLRLIQTWFCPNCHSRNLAQIVIDGTTIVAFDPLPFERASTVHAQYLDDRSAKELSP